MNSREDMLGMGAALVALGIACGVTWMVLRLTRHRGLMDCPNERSAHQVPMPTGGGLGIIAGFWGGWILIWIVQSGDGMIRRENLVAWGLGTVALLVMAADDFFRPLKVGEKMVLLCLATGAWLIGAGPLDGLTLPWVGWIGLGVWGWALTAFWFLALCNACNFMDGIDGITGTQTISVGFFALLCLWRLDGCWIEAGLLIGATAGFLIFNFPPGRIFIGDVGSNFVGFVLAGLGILGERVGLPLWIFAAFMGYYLFDTGYTLIRRALRGENVLRAHRKHLYQRLDRLGWSHLQIDLWVLLINAALGSGGYLYLFTSRSWGMLLMAGGGVLLLAETIWIERKDRSFV